VHGKPIGDRLLNQWHMRNQSHGASLTHDILENLKDLIQCAGVVFGVEAAKSLVDENRIEPDGPIGHFHDIRKTENQRQRSSEGFAAR